jgi:hypothetical protein
VTVDYAIHVIYHLDDTSATDHHPLSAFEQAGVPGWSRVTAIAAFLVMMGSPLHGYQQPASAR